MPSVQKQLRKLIQREGAEWIHEQDAWLGNYSQTVETGTPGILWARLINGRVVRVHNAANAPSDFDLHVKIGENRHMRKIWQIIRVVEDYDTPAAGGRVAYHHTQHEFPAGDTVWVNRKQVVAFTVLVSDAAGFKVQFYGGAYPTRDAIVKAEPEEIDLSSYVGYGAKYVSIEVDEAGVVSVHEGEDFGDPTVATEEDIPMPDPGTATIAYILLYEGQAELSNDDIVVVMPVAYRAYTTGQDISDATADTPDAGDRIPFTDTDDLDNPLRYIEYTEFLEQLRAYYEPFYLDASHSHALARWNSSGGTTFDLPDIAEQVLVVSDNGAIVDPLTYTLSSDGTQIVFDSAVTAANVVTAEYIPRRA